MQHLYVLYFWMTLSIGIISLGATLTFYVKTRDELLRYYLYFYTPFTLLVVLNVLRSYVQVYVTGINLYMMLMLNYFERPIALYLLMFTIPVFIHYFVSIPHTRRRNIFLGCLTLLMLIIHHLSVAVSPGYPILVDMGAAFEDVVFMAVMLYCFLIGLRRYPALQDAFRKSIAQKMILLFGLFLPGIASDTFLSDVVRIRFFPILYCGFSLLFTSQFLRHYQQKPPTLPPEYSESPMPPNTFFTQHTISAREKEVIALMIQGETNQQIGDALCISLNTVKTHIRNIYQKFGVNNREDLNALLNDALQ